MNCIASLENCPNEELNKEYADSMRRCLFSEKLVLDTVFSSKFEPVSTRAFRHDKFVHTVLVTLNVKKSWLDGSAEQFIRKHLGQQKWTLENGTDMRLSKIHKKD